MKCPCPLPLRDAWSPVGYRVVEVAEEVPTAVPAPPRPPQGPPSGAAPKRLPFSTVGYQVVPVAEETIPEPPPHYPVARRPRPRPPAGIHPLAIWGPCALVAFFVVVFLSACALASRPAPRPDLPVAVNAAPVGQADIQAGGVVIPKADPADAAAEEKAKPPAKGAVPDPAAAGKAACQPGERETFGTAVQFARNPLEAMRDAAQQRKLAFVLHVSGNFEEARFT